MMMIMLPWRAVLRWAGSHIPAGPSNYVTDISSGNCTTTLEFGVLGGGEATSSYRGYMAVRTTCMLARSHPLRREST